MGKLKDQKFNLKATVFDSVIVGYFLTLLTVAILQPDHQQMLNLGSNVWFVLFYFVIAGILSVLINKNGIKTLGGQVFESPLSKGKGTVKKWYETFWGVQLLIIFGSSFIVAIYVTGFSLRELLDEQGLMGAKRIFFALASPNFELLPKGVLAIIETVFIAFLATTVAIPVAFLLAFFAAKNIMGKSRIGFVVYFVLRTILNVMRSIEPLIWAIVFSVWVGIGSFAGVLALMIHSIVSLTKQYSEMIEAVDDGPIEGIMATGANPIQVIWFAIVPQVVLPYISFTIYRWDINVRMATVIGLVGGGGIGTLLIQYQGQAMWSEVGCLAMLIVIVVWSMDTSSAYIREALK
jgi:phosphonate transport system permease protein